jgi:hypothetical protein
MASASPVRVAARRHRPMGGRAAGDLCSICSAKQVIKEFRSYVCGNRRSLPDFAKQRAAGHRISTAHVESVMNHLVNHRLSKKQQMRWSPEGAHYLLQVRAELLNGTLTDAYRVANLRFRGTSGFAQAVH